MFSRILPVKPSDPEFSFVSRFLIIDWSSLHTIDLFKICISSWFIHGKFCVSRNLLISSRLSSLLVYNYSYSSVMIPHITVVLVVMSPLPFLILSVWICESSLSQLAHRVVSMQGSWPWGGACMGEVCGVGHAGGDWGPLEGFWGKLSPGPCERAIRRNLWHKQRICFPFMPSEGLICLSLHHSLLPPVLPLRIQYSCLCERERGLFGSILHCWRSQVLTHMFLLPAPSITSHRGRSRSWEGLSWP